MAVLDQGAHLAVEEGEQKRADVGAVDVGIGHDDDLVVADLGNVEGDVARDLVLHAVVVGLHDLLVVVVAAVDSRDHRADLGVLELPFEVGLLDVQDLAAQGQDRLRAVVAAGDGRAAGGVALHEEELAFGGVVGLAVRELAEEAAEFGAARLEHLVLDLLGRLAGAHRLEDLVDDLRADLRVLLEVVLELLEDELLDDALDLAVAELGLGLALELGRGVEDEDDAGETLADVLARRGGVVFLEELLVLREGVDDRRERGLEAFEVGAALVRVDAVGVGEDRLVPLGLRVDHRDAHLHDEVAAGGVVVADLLGAADFDDGRRGEFGAEVEGLDVAGDAVGVAELLAAAGRLLGEADVDAGVQEGELVEALGEDVPLEGAGRAVGFLEDCVVEVEGDRRAGAFRGADDMERLGDLAAREADAVALAVAADLDLHPLGEGVDALDADAVEAAGDLVAAGAELAAGVELGQHDLDGGAVFGRVHVDRDAARLVRDRARAVRVEGDVDVLAVAGHELVDAVVDHLVDAVVVALLKRVANVHRRAHAHGLQTLEVLDLLGIVVAFDLDAFLQVLFFRHKSSLWNAIRAVRRGARPTVLKTTPSIIPKKHARACASYARRARIREKQGADGSAAMMV